MSIQFNDIRGFIISPPENTQNACAAGKLAFTVVTCASVAAAAIACLANSPLLCVSFALHALVCREGFLVTRNIEVLTSGLSANRGRSLLNKENFVPILLKDTFVLKAAFSSLLLTVIH